MTVLGSVLSNVIGPIASRLIPSGGVPDSLLTGLVSWWGLDQASGKRWDSHGNTHLTESVPLLQAVGKINSATQFIQTNFPYEYLFHGVGHGCHAGSRDFTFVCWVYLDDLQNQGIGRVGLGNLGQNHDWLMYYQASGLDRFRFFVPNGSSFWSTTANTFGVPSINTWYFLLGQYDFSSGTLGISVNNGTLDTLAGKTSPNTTGRDLQIGRYDVDVNLMNGRIDEPAFWSRLLTSDEKSRVYNSGAGIFYPGQD